MSTLHMYSSGAPVAGQACGCCGGSGNLPILRRNSNANERGGRQSVMRLNRHTCRSHFVLPIAPSAWCEPGWAPGGKGGTGLTAGQCSRAASCGVPSGLRCGGAAGASVAGGRCGQGTGMSMAPLPCLVLRYWRMARLRVYTAKSAMNTVSPAAPPAAAAGAVLLAAPASGAAGDGVAHHRAAMSGSCWRHCSRRWTRDSTNAPACATHRKTAPDGNRMCTCWLNFVGVLDSSSSTCRASNEARGPKTSLAC